MKPDFPKNANEITSWTWADIEPHFRVLSDTDISPETIDA